MVGHLTDKAAASRVEAEMVGNDREVTLEGTGTGAGPEGRRGEMGAGSVPEVRLDRTIVTAVVVVEASNGLPLLRIAPTTRPGIAYDTVAAVAAATQTLPLLPSTPTRPSVGHMLLSAPAKMDSLTSSTEELTTAESRRPN